VLADLSGFALFVEAAKIKMTSIALAKIFVNVWQSFHFSLTLAIKLYPGLYKKCALFVRDSSFSSHFFYFYVLCSWMKNT
jgi:hypothetical protein